MTNLPPANATETIVELPRLSALCDGVYAIALTLLAFEIRLPEDLLAGDLPANLFALFPRLFICLVSFIVIGGAWGSHQRMLSQIKRGDGLLVWFNLLSLLFVTLLPASSSILGRFPATFAGIFWFALNVILIQLSALLVWWHASRNHLINPALDPRVIDGISRRLVLSAVAFMVSVPLALLNAVLVYVIWIGLFVLIFTTDWLSWIATRTIKIAVPLAGAIRGEIDVIQDVGSLRIEGGGGNDQLIVGTCGGGVEMQSTREGDILKTQLKAPTRRGLMSIRYPWAWNSSAALDWNIMLNSRIPLRLNLVSTAGACVLDFRDIRLSDLQVQANAASVELWLPAHAGQTKMQLRGNASSFFVHIPSSVAVHIHAPTTHSGLQIDPTYLPMVEEGREYRSEDYNTAANRVDLQVELAWGSVEIR